MPTFKITAVDPKTQQEKTLLYTTEFSTLTDENYVSLTPAKPFQVDYQDPGKMPKGKAGIKTLKIQLGLSCNYSCEYCSQRFVPHAEATHQEQARAFLANLDTWLKEAPEKIEFWGGEPFVYWKTMKPLAEALRAKFAGTQFAIITNGSLLDDEKVEWLDRLGFQVGLSHDGPGQSVRGPDPLDDPQLKQTILKLYRLLAPKNRFSFNAMIHKGNQSRAAVQQFFLDLVGQDHQHLAISEGGFIDAYDEGGAALSLAADDMARFRARAFGEIRSGQASLFVGAVQQKVASFVNSLRLGRPLASVGQKCGMDQPDKVAVDLHGNVLTCQNVSSVSVNPAGIAHKIGHVSDLDAVELKTGTHWTDREECPKCPMVHICKGSCLFLSGPLWDASCDNAFSDAVPIFAAGIEFLTGLVPVRIEGPHRADRQDLWRAATPAPSSQRVIPIQPLAA